ncbi:MAG: hypothetical protein LQ351_003707 [Letrouitia transgressa]|nr:MAG: hypothetical protein LQ351_003707 [Letrouitia transgressa]
MLLPSALPSDPLQRPYHLAIPPSPLSPDRPATTAHTACLTLQSLLNTTTPQSQWHQLRRSRRHLVALQSPIHLPSNPFNSNSSRPKNKTKTKPFKIHKPAPLKPKLHLRSRSHPDQENILLPPQTPTQQPSAPPSLPLGLETADFESLAQPAAGAVALEKEGEGKEGKGEGPTTRRETRLREQISSYDEALVALLLKQLELRHWEWDRARGEVKARGGRMR